MIGNLARQRNSIHLNQYMLIYPNLWAIFPNHASLRTNMSHQQEQVIHNPSVSLSLCECISNTTAMRWDIFLRDSFYQLCGNVPREDHKKKKNLNVSLRTIGVISPNQMGKSLYISPNHDSQYIACRLLWIAGSNCNVCPYMDLGAFTFNSQDLNKYVCLVNVQSLFSESSHVTAEFVYINGSDRRVPPVNR